MKNEIQEKQSKKSEYERHFPNETLNLKKNPFTLNSNLNNFNLNFNKKNNFKSLSSDIKVLSLNCLNSNSRNNRDFIKRKRNMTVSNINSFWMTSSANKNILFKIEEKEDEDPNNKRTDYQYITENNKIYEESSLFLNNFRSLSNLSNLRIPKNSNSIKRNNLLKKQNSEFKVQNNIANSSKNSKLKIPICTFDLSNATKIIEKNR